MNIEYKNNKYCLFGLLKFGDIFKIAGTVMLKIDNHYKCNSVSLEDGQTAIYQDTLEVEGPLNHKLIIL